MGDKLFSYPEVMTTGYPKPRLPKEQYCCIVMGTLSNIPRCSNKYTSSYSHFLEE